MSTPAPKGTPRLSIVLPAYNEASRIVPSLESIQDYLTSHRIDAEVIVVDDGSTDGTPDVVRRLIPRFERGSMLRVLLNPGNRGKGYSVRHGVLDSTGEQVLFTDSDLSSPIEEYAKLAAPIERREAAIAIGSRALPNSRVEVHQSRLREAYGRAFNAIVRAATGLPFRDTQCGFKLFTRAAAQSVFSLQVLEGFGFDVEILYIAKKLGIPAVEIPVVWRNVEGSRVRLMSGAQAFLDVLKVLRQDAKGGYTPPRSVRSKA
jgi:glycosyltransferase involved in cell wall biosynthesis